VKAPADESEVSFLPGDPEGYVKALAQLKNRAAYALLSDKTEGILLTADTVVVSSDKEIPLGKPHDREQAVAMLSSLSGDHSSVFNPIDSPAVARTDEEFATAWRFTSNGDPIYGHFLPVEDHDALLFVNGELHGQIYTNETDCLLYLGTFPAGQPVEVTLITTAPAERRIEVFCELDTAVLTRAANVLEQNALQVTSYSNGKLEGTVTAAADGWLYTSIPAQPGWTVRVDGCVTEHAALHDALILVPLTAGEHTVSFTYTPPGLYAGLSLTAIGLALGLWLLRKKK